MWRRKKTKRSQRSQHITFSAHFTPNARPPPHGTRKSFEYTVTAFIFEKFKFIKICKFAFPASMTDHSSTKFNKIQRIPQFRSSFMRADALADK